MKFVYTAALFVAMAMVVLQDDLAAQSDLFVSAASANSVMRFDGQTGEFKGNFVAPNAGGLSDPQGIKFGPDGNLYVSSNGSNSVLRFDGQTGEFMDVFATVTGMTWPAEINFVGDHLFVSDFAAAGRVSRFDAISGDFVDHFITGAAFADGQAWDADGNILVSSFSNGSVRKYNGTTGDYIEDFVTPGLGGLSGALDNLLLENGQLLVSSFNTASVKRYDSDGTYVDDVITGLAGPQGLELGPDGFLYAGSFSNGFINRYNADTFQLEGQFAVAPGSTTNNFTFAPIAIPEPGSSAVFLLNALLLCVTRRRKTV